MIYIYNIGKDFQLHYDNETRNWNLLNYFNEFRNFNYWLRFHNIFLLPTKESDHKITGTQESEYLFQFSKFFQLNCGFFTWKNCVWNEYTNKTVSQFYSFFNIIIKVFKRKNVLKFFENNLITLLKHYWYVISFDL